jgi:hypothetical protein
MGKRENTLRTPFNSMILIILSAQAEMAPYLRTRESRHQAGVAVQAVPTVVAVIVVGRRWGGGAGAQGGGGHGGGGHGGDGVHVLRAPRPAGRSAAARRRHLKAIVADRLVEVLPLGGGGGGGQGRLDWMAQRGAGGGGGQAVRSSPRVRIQGADVRLATVAAMTVDRVPRQV